jgi:transposase
MRTHTLVAIDDAGRKLAEKTVTATPEGHLEAVEWAQRWPEPQFALEDCRHVTRRLESDLLLAGEPVVRVPTRLMAGARKGGRKQGKSDPIDALAVAGLRNASRTCRWRASMEKPARCGCSSTIATSSSGSGPASRAGCVGASR